MPLFCTLYLTHVLTRNVDLALSDVTDLVDHRTAGHYSESQRQPEERLQQHQILDVVAELVALHREAEDGRVDADCRTGGGKHEPTQRWRTNRCEVEERWFGRTNVGFLLFDLSGN